MSDAPKSSGEKHIETIMRELDPGSPRYLVLDTARRFKSSWVELGERLLAVSSANLFREWGYDSFEDYCSREIRIKKPTAQKLTLAYRYMEKDEPELLARQSELKPLPDFRNIDLLRQAREEKNFSNEEYAELRKAVVEEERSHPTILKRFKEVAAREEPPADPSVHLKAGLSAARRLDTALRSAEQIPEEICGQIARIVEYLETRLEAAQNQAEDG
ncbi:hypothetical protein DESUT3_29690 [Desulfuromonas versatilis]|uniref:DUF3102 domain-containing protein n=1 Tax=Desulfuromonas versatilis TaxID=2802975 RepID=A0ABM8HUA0_9BACT|nr:hypothetical protein [Desulfuromonas versatilis]BCR05900.1 hypothetical protein DESUT3_29690 [Desulfuromonas versatilis]